MEPEGFREFRDSKVQLFSRLKPRNIFPGEWESEYRGDGIEFAEIKPFEPGDDLRDLDLQALVQSGEEEIIQRVVERQMRLYVWLDLSGSMQHFKEMIFPQKPEIRDIALGLLLFSACNTYSPVGLCAFNAENKRFFPARVGERYCWEILSWIIEEDFRGRRAAGDVRGALSLLLERASPRSLVFLVSDFHDETFTGDFSSLLKPLLSKFDLVPVMIRDPLEIQGTLKKSVRLTIEDSEGGQGQEIHLTPQKLVEMQAASARQALGLQQTFRSLGIDPIVLDTASVESCHRTLTGYFQARQRTRR